MLRIDVPREYDDNPAGWAHATLAPEISRAFNEYSVQVYKNVAVPLRVFEAARARVALINGCLRCIAWRSADDVPGYLDKFGADFERSGWAQRAEGFAPGEDFYENLENWRTWPGYSEQEKTAIELAERFSLEPQSMDHDEPFWARVKEQFTDAELFSLIMSIGSFVAGGRLMHILGFDENACAVTPLTAVAPISQTPQPTPPA